MIWNARRRVASLRYRRRNNNIYESRRCEQSQRERAFTYWFFSGTGPLGGENT